MTMSLTVIWLVMTAVLGIAEMLVGTFYLLVLAVASFIAAMSSFMDVSIEWQLVWFSVVSLGGCVWVRRIRVLNLSVNEKESYELQNLDEGQVVEVIGFNAQGRTKVQYRGAEWMAQAAQGQSLEAGTWQIVEVLGNVLVIKKI